MRDLSSQEPSTANAAQAHGFHRTALIDTRQGPQSPAAAAAQSPARHRPSSDILVTNVSTHTGAAGCLNGSPEGHFRIAHRPTATDTSADSQPSPSAASTGVLAPPSIPPAALPASATAPTAAPVAAMPAMPSTLGGHGYVYVLGYGVMPVVPCLPPGWTRGMHIQNTQPAPQPATHPAPYPASGLPPAYLPQGQGAHMVSTAAHPLRPDPHSAQMPCTNSIAPTPAAAPLAPLAQVPDGHTLRPFPQLSSFKSLEDLYRVVTYGDPVSETLPLSALAAADPNWRKGFSKRYFEFDSAVKEMSELAAAESKQTGQAPLKV